MSKDVFPDPVLLTMRLIVPLINMSSPSIFSGNLRLEGFGAPSESFDQLNVAFRKPISCVGVTAGKIKSLLV